MGLFFAQEEMNAIDLQSDKGAYPTEGSLGKHGSALNDKFSAPATTVEDVAVGIEKAIIEENAEMVVNPWDVAGEIDYTKLIEKFGSQEIDAALLARAASASASTLNTSPSGKAAAAARRSSFTCAIGFV